MLVGIGMLVGIAIAVGQGSWARRDAKTLQARGIRVGIRLPATLWRRAVQTYEQPGHWHWNSCSLLSYARDRSLCYHNPMPHVPYARPAAHAVPSCARLAHGPDQPSSIPLLGWSAVDRPNLAEDLIEPPLPMGHGPHPHPMARRDLGLAPRPRSPTRIPPLYSPPQRLCTFFNGD